MEDVPAVPEEAAYGNIVEMLPHMSPLEQRYLAQRLLEPEKDPVEIMHDLRIPQDAYHRWRFPALMERVIDNMVPGLATALARSMLEKHLPKAAATLIDRLDSKDEKVSQRAAERILEGQGVLARNGGNIIIGGQHLTISDVAAQTWHDDKSGVDRSDTAVT